MSDHNIVKLEKRCSVVIRRGDRAHTKSFAYSRWGGQLGALRVARAWRDRKLEEMPPQGRQGGLRRRSLAGKRSQQPVGVSEHVGRDGRLRFSVNWTDEDGRTRIKTFSAGQAKTAAATQVRKAERAARRFRKAFEAAKAAGVPFDPAEHE